MSRRGFGLASIAAVVFAALPPAAVAAADPASVPCSFTLSAPKVVQVSGRDMVIATLSPGGCSAPASPYLSVACLQIKGGNSPGECAQADGPSTARVYHPYRKGATYLATGRGCVTAGNPPRPECQTRGPSPATL